MILRERMSRWATAVLMGLTLGAGQTASGRQPVAGIIPPGNAGTAPMPPVDGAQAFLAHMHGPLLWPGGAESTGIPESQWRYAATSVMKATQGLWGWEPPLTSRPPDRSWPGFQLRVTTDNKSFYGFPAHYTGKLPLAPGGTIFPEGATIAKVTYPERTWAAMRVRYELAGGAENWMDMTISRLSPAVLLDVNQAGEMNFFGDLLFDIIPRGNKDVQPKPRFVAIPTKDGIKVLTGPGQFDLSEMSEGWMLVWFGMHSYISSTQLPTQQQYHWSNATWPKKALAHYDCPWLLVFGQKPAKLTLHEPANVDVPETEPLDDTCDKPTFRYWEKRLTTKNTESGKLKGMTVGFAGKAGQIALMPLYGNRYVLMAETEKWGAGGPPAAVTADCRKWNGVLRAFPVAADERYQVKADQSAVTVTVDVNYRMLDCPLGDKPRKIAPVSGMLALAGGLLGESGPVKFSAPLVDLDCPSTTGPACGVEGADSYSYAFAGLEKYLWQRPADVSADKLPASAKPLLAKLDAHADEMFKLGVLAPVLFSPTRENPAPWYRFGDPGELAMSLEMARPLLSAERQKQIDPYMQAELKVAPFGSAPAPFWTGARREAGIWPESVSKVLVNGPNWPPTWWAEDYYAVGTRFDRYGQAVPGKEQLAAAIQAALVGPEDWNSGLVDLPQPPRNYQFNTGYAGQLNAYIQQTIGCARLADCLGRRDLAELAAYRFAKAAAQRIACERLVDYMYHSRQLAVPTDVDWSAVLVKNNGTGFFIPDRWRGAEDDVRGVAGLDASGAEFWPFLILRGHSTQFSHFMNMTPELGRLLGDHAKGRIERTYARLEQRLPSWWLTRGPKGEYVHSEALYSPPDNAWQMLLLARYGLGKDGDHLAGRIDVPFCPGDLYHIQKLAAAATAYAPTEWVDVRKK